MEAKQPTVKCSQCKQYKPPSEFTKDSSKKNGLYSYCFNCRRANWRAYKEKIEKKYGMSYYKHKQLTAGDSKDRCPACHHRNLINHPGGYKICGWCKEVSQILTTNRST